jgi:uncharacterized coiled-coil protein SlyX
MNLAAIGNLMDDKRVQIAALEEKVRSLERKVAAQERKIRQQDRIIDFLLDEITKLMVEKGC